MIETNLLTGASGFLGKVILSTLVPDYKIKTLNRSNHHGLCLTDHVCPTDQKTNHYSVNLAKTIPIFQESFKTIIHASGKAHVIPRTPQEAEDFFAVNYIGTVNLTKALEALEVLPKYFIFISTVAVYGQESGELIDEEHPLQGSSPYAKSKIEAEKFLAVWCAKNNILLTILRLPLLVAADPPGNLGAMIKMMKKGMYLGIGNGKARKSMVLAKDVATFIPTIQTYGGIYNLTDGNHPSMLELELALATRLKRRKPTRLPDAVLKGIAKVGDLLGNKSPLNSAKYKKLVSSLTFSDAKARNIGWNPREVITNLPF